MYVDDSVFDEQFLPANWLPRYAHERYSAQVGGVNLNANCVDFYLRVGSFGELVTYGTSPATRYVTIRNTCLTGNKN